MSHYGSELFTSSPWSSHFEGIQGLPPGMLGHHEASLLHNLARDYYRGYGEIVDAGSFLGASSWCFTKGVEENSSIGRKPGRIHAYDLFQVWSEPGGTDAQMAEWLRKAYGIEVAGYESTVGIYMQNLGALGRLVSVHQGDILKQSWSGRPIELMFVDICKVRSIWQHVVRSFFPSLIPGVSLVIHQDWHHPWLPYLHVGQEALADYFEIVVPKANDTAVFRLVDRIPERMIDRVANYEFTPEEEVELISRAVKRFADFRQARFVKLAKAELLRRYKRFDEASNIVHNAGFRFAEPMTADERPWFEVQAADLAARIEAEAMHEAPAGFEAGYLAHNPDVQAVISAGHLESGYHHWFRHGRWEGRRTGLEPA